jgi:hypothetical protein
MSVTINGTTGIAGANGSASTPAVQGEDTNTGVFFPAADTVAVATGGSERMRVDSSGNVGIGTTSPAAAFDVTRSGGFSVVSAGNGTTRLNVGVSSDNTTFLEVPQAQPLRFLTSGTERARIDSSGNLAIGSTSSGADGTNTGIWCRGGIKVLQVSRDSDPCANLYRLGTDGSTMTFNKGTTLVGSISVTGSSTAYNTSSDYRLKENVQPIQDALAVIAQLNPVTYTWKADGSDGQGFIAHELQAVVPDCVTGEKDAVDAEGNPQYQGVDTSFLVATLVAALKELKAEVDSLKAQLEAN